MNNIGSLAKFLVRVKTAGVPDRVTFEFLKTLGFKSSNDRPIITVMKAIGFLDGSGAPTALYKAYRGNDGPRVLAAALREAYRDLFVAHTSAHKLSIDDLKGIIASKTTKGEPTVLRIAKTFSTLAKAADFSSEASDDVEDDSDEVDAAEPERIRSELPQISHPRHSSPTFHYNIEIHLPTTTDVTVYNAIFRSLRENLL